ncbi:MAG: ribokinase [Limnobaculum xujianqingii]|uniref:ribokinase n=1 Tax=Limnobaculum xujianqingii TaxID=2738837 RepID=UPI00112661C1|nr:ribokinase [Limnobaculum xujianqingii]
MFLEERREKILTFLDKNERATVNQLAAMFSVSKETIRYDLRVLAQKSLLLRCHGGAQVLRKTLQSDLITPSSDMDIASLLKKIGKKKKRVPLARNSQTTQGNVCILGSFNVDIVAKVERFPKGGESLMAINSTLGPGGKGANQAMAASNAGAKVHFVCKTGKDQFSQFAYRHLSDSAIHSFTLYQSDDASTGNAVIYVSQQDGENMIAIYPGANKTITESEIIAISEQLKKSDVLLVQLENNFDATFNVMRLANALGVKIILNPAPYSHEILQFIELANIITPNETEASLLSGVEVTDIASAQQAAREIAHKGVQTVIITLGSNGALLYENNQFQHIPALPAVAVDTTGAGDAFTGALTAAIASGQNLGWAVKYATAFASLAVEREGASNMPVHQQVLHRLSLNADF